MGRLHLEALKLRDFILTLDATDIWNICCTLGSITLIFLHWENVNKHESPSTGPLLFLYFLRKR